MSRELKFGKINSVALGFGGYQDAMFGFAFSLRGKNWGCQDFIGAWSDGPSENARWTKEEQEMLFLKSLLKVKKIMERAKVKNFKSLEGVPIAANFEGGKLKEWDILEDVL